MASWMLALPLWLFDNGDPIKSDSGGIQCSHVGSTLPKHQLRILKDDEDHFQYEY